MAVANLVLSYVKALIWPSIVLILSTVFRRELRGLFGRVSSVEAGGASVKFNEDLRATNAKLRNANEVSTRAELYPAVVTPVPEVAEAASSVLRAHPVWPHLPATTLWLDEAAPWAEGRRELTELVRETRGAFAHLVPMQWSTSIEFQDWNEAPINVPRPVIFDFHSLERFTGIPGWTDLGSAIGRLYWSVPSSLKTRRRARAYVETLNLALATFRTLLEATVTAHTPPAPRLDSGVPDGASV